MAVSAWVRLPWRRSTTHMTDGCRSLLIWLLPVKIQGVQERHDLPALGFGQLRPHWHALSHKTVGHNPEERPRRSLLHFTLQQTGPASSPASFLPVALGTVPGKEFSTGDYFLEIAFEWIHPRTRRIWNARERRERNVITLRNRSPCRLRRQEGGGADAHRRAHPDGTGQGPVHRAKLCRYRFHGRPPRRCRTVSPKPENSRETPQRSSSR